MKYGQNEEHNIGLTEIELYKRAVNSSFTLVYFNHYTQNTSPSRCGQILVKCKMDNNTPPSFDNDLALSMLRPQYDLCNVFLLWFEFKQIVVHLGNSIAIRSL